MQKTQWVCVWFLFTPHLPSPSLLRVYFKLTVWPAPRSLESSVGRACSWVRIPFRLKFHSYLSCAKAKCALLTHTSKIDSSLFLASNLREVGHTWLSGNKAYDWHVKTSTRLVVSCYTDGKKTADTKISVLANIYWCRRPNLISFSTAFTLSQFTPSGYYTNIPKETAELKFWIRFFRSLTVKSQWSS